MVRDAGVGSSWKLCVWQRYPGSRPSLRAPGASPEACPVGCAGAMGRRSKAREPDSARANQVALPPTSCAKFLGTAPKCWKLDTNNRMRETALTDGCGLSARHGERRHTVRCGLSWCGQPLRCRPLATADTGPRRHSAVGVVEAGRCPCRPSTGAALKQSKFSGFAVSNFWFLVRVDGTFLVPNDG